MRLLGYIYNSRKAKPNEKEGTDLIKALNYVFHGFHENGPKNQNRNRP